MSARTDFAILRVRQIGARMTGPVTRTLEVFAGVIVYSAIGALLAWRG